MNRFAAAHPEDWEDRLDAMTDDADLVERKPPKGYDPLDPQNSPEDYPQYASRCAACGEPCSRGQRWCSDSCFRAEDGDYRRDEIDEDDDDG